MWRYLVSFAILAALSSGDRQFIKNSVDFSTKLYQETVKEQGNENILIAPLAIQSVLGLVYMGADQVTANEMVTGLHLESNDKTTNAAKFKELLEIHSNNPALHMGNKIFVKPGYAIKPEFENVAINKFKSEIDNINFAETAETVKTINNWASSKTNNEIDEFLELSDMDSETEILLTSVNYFHDSFKNTFDSRYTRPRPFWTSRRGSSNIDMMSMTLKVFSKFSDDLNAKVIKLPFKTEGTYMLIMLPWEQFGLKNLEKNLHKINLLEYAESMDTEVEYDEITIPKFRIVSNQKLKSVLEQMGMETMFSSNADFSNMVESSQSKITKAITESYVDVNEEGPNPGTKTKLRNFYDCIPCGPTPIEFIADHPFFYAIMNENGVLFAGRYVTPEGY